MGKIFEYHLELLNGDHWHYDDPNMTSEVPPQEVAPSLVDITSDTLFALFGINTPSTVMSGPVFPRRGLPPDISPYLKHTHSLSLLPELDSWLYVRELGEFQWDRVIEIDINTPTSEEYRYLNSGMTGTTWKRFGGEYPLTHVHWACTCKVAAGQVFMQNGVYKLLEKYGKTEKARVVYWFSTA